MQELDPLNPEEARQLFLEEGFPPETQPGALDLEKINRITERVGRLPLFIRLAARQCRQGVSPALPAGYPSVLPRSGLLDGNRIAGLPEQPVSGAAGDERGLEIIARLAAFPAHHAAIEALQTGVPKRDFYTAESFLAERGIIERQPNDRLQMHGFLALWLQDAAADTYAAELAAVEGWLLDFARRGAIGEDYAPLDAEQANLIGLLERLKEEERGPELVELHSHLFDYLRVRGLWGMNLQALDAALQELIGAGRCAPDRLGRSASRHYAHPARRASARRDRSEPSG